MNEITKVPDVTSSIDHYGLVVAICGLIVVVILWFLPWVVAMARLASKRQIRSIFVMNLGLIFPTWIATTATPNQDVMVAFVTIIWFGLLAWAVAAIKQRELRKL